MTILEVLFAIMITSVGLLGAIAVFPVASEYARKGRLNDEVTVCADAAVHKMDAMGMRRPERWITWRVVNGNWIAASGPGMVIAGESYCLDPRFVATNLVPNGSPPPPLVPNYLQATAFPAYPGAPPAYATNNHPAFIGSPPRMQRITLVTGTPNVATPPYLPIVFPMGRFQADYVFSFEDQLAYERPGVQKGEVARADNAEPAFQLYSGIKDVANNQILPGKREDEGKLSWMATLVPKIDQHSGTVEDKYVLSIVVFYSRSPSLTIPDFSAPPITTPLNEWTATILGPDFHSSGYGGGEATITADNPEKLKMRAGDWLMLSGYIRGPADVGSTATDTLGNTPPYTVRKTFKWYRVTEADEDPYQNGNVYQRDVTLVGPDWDQANVLPLQIDSTTGNLDSYPDNIIDDVEVTIVPGIVAVSDRTVRLELGGTGY